MALFLMPLNELPEHGTSLKLPGLFSILHISSKVFYTFLESLPINENFNPASVNGQMKDAAFFLKIYATHSCYIHVCAIYSMYIAG